MDTNEIRKLACDEANLLDRDTDGIHGLLHWEMVGCIAQVLLEANGHNPAIGPIFGYLHDCQRYNDEHDPEHGERAEAYARRNRQQIPLDDPDFEQLCDAMRIHHRAGSDYGPTVIGCLCDADRLDLGRVGTTPGVEWMSTPQALDLLQNDHHRLSNDQGHLVALWHGSVQLDYGDRLEPRRHSPAYLTEHPVNAENYGDPYKILLFCRQLADILDIAGTIRLPIFEHLLACEQTLKDELPETFREDGRAFNLLDCVEYGDLYHQMGRDLSETFLRELHGYGYDAICLHEDARTHHVQGERIATWVTYNKTLATLRF